MNSVHALVMPPEYVGREKMEFLQDIGLDTKSGKGYTGSEEKYMAALQRFYRSYEKNKKKVEEYLAAEDYESYMITVHALKSNAKMIGAMSLSTMFEELENASREKQINIVKEKNAPAMKAYGELIVKLEPIGVAPEVHAADEISGKEAKETAESLLAALDDFDDDLSKELIKKLSGYPFRMTQMDLLKKAEEYIHDFLYDEAAEIVKEIVPAIEE